MKKKYHVFIKNLLYIYLIICILFINTSSLNRNAKYGFWHDSTDLNSYQPDWSALTHVAYYAWDVNKDGTLSNPSNMSNYISVRNVAHRHRVKVILSIITPSDPTVTDNILANHKTDFASNVLNTVQMNGADGVNLDFEYPTNTNSITNTSNISLFEEFMATLYKTLKASNPNYHISICTPWDINKVDCFKNPNLKNYVDSVFLMCYDWSSYTNVTEPNSPFDDPTRYDTQDSVQDTSNYFTKSQIILGLPFYGYDYTTISSTPGAHETGYTPIDISDAVKNAEIYGRLWDSNSHTPWYVYQSNGVWHQVWYDDSQSLGLKYQYAKSQNLGGIGFWALGCEVNQEGSGAKNFMKGIY
jgi:GH18 family chitinase